MNERVEELRSPIVRALIDHLTLEKLGLEHRELVSQALGKFPPRISEYTFSNLFAWNCPQRWVGSYQGHLLIGQDYSDQMLFLHPIGSSPVHVMRELASLPGLVWTRVEETLALELHEELNVQPQREHFDYVYHRTQITTLRHPQLKKHRSRIERFEKEYSPIVVRLDACHLGECERILLDWTGTRDLDSDLRKEVDAASTALRYFLDWELFGIGVIVDSLFVGYGIAESLNEQTYVVHYTKTAPGYGDLPRFLFRALVEQMPANVLHVNSMQDLDLPGLRISKQEWRPSHMVEKYLVSKAS